MTKDRRPLARLRLLHRNPVFVVECDVYPVGLALVDPRPLGPYTFQRRDDALAFLQDAAHALGYLGCVVDDPFALVDQAAQIG